MPTIASFPSLFGRATAFLEEHESLRDTLDRVQSYCILLGQAGVAEELDPQHLLEQLGRLMLDHFAREEADDYFGMFRREAPWVNHRLEELETEHWQILELLGELRSLAQDARERDRLVDGLERLLERVDAHELGEVSLLQSFFSPAEVPQANPERVAV